MSANQNDPQFKLRVPPELKAKIEQSAKEHNRSMNADMVARLEKSFEAEATIQRALPSLPPEYAERLMDHITKSVLEGFKQAAAGGTLKGFIANLNRE